MAEARAGLHKSVVAEAINGGHLKLGPPTGPRWHSYPLDPESVAKARGYAARLLAEAEVTDDDHILNVTLVVSELVTNAVRYARTGSDMHVGVAILPRWTHLFIQDPLPKAPGPAPLDPPEDALEESGRGLPIVDALTARTNFVVGTRDKTAHAVVLRSGVVLTKAEHVALDRLVSV